MSSTVRVNPIACEGHGLCAELFPEWIGLDDWGYPIVRAEAVPGRLLPHARRAVAACPALALRLVQEEGGRRRSSGRADPAAPGRRR